MATNASTHGSTGKVHLAAGHDAVKALQSAIKKVSAHSSASTMGGGRLVGGTMKGSETISAGHNKITADTFSGGAARGAAFHVGADTISSRKDLFVFKSDHAGSSHVIQAFSHGDKLTLAGYSKAEIAAALHSQKVVGGSLTFKLADKTTVTISGLEHKLHSSDFIIK